MSNNSSFIRNNKFVPLVSDVLPYEVPIKFSNYGIYQTLKKEYHLELKNSYCKKVSDQEEQHRKTAENFFIERYFPQKIRETLKNVKYTIPYMYNIKKSSNNFRQISLLHPLAQLKICDFYDEYKDSIIFNTNKSQYSLRYPYKVAKIVHRDLSQQKISLLKYWDDPIASQTVDLQEDVNEDSNQINDTKSLISTFFIYKKYSHLFKFYESTEFLQNEKNFLFLTKLDISNFFYNIYSHTIAWAVKDKQYAKFHINQKESFEAKFDKLMQFSNYNETNGIPIGSETSRIFAEIIMQRIDINIEERLSEYKYYFKIYRYVDYP